MLVCACVCDHSPKPACDLAAFWRTCPSKLRSMKARKIRQRSIPVADDEEGDDGASEALRKSVAARKQQKEKKGGKKPLLSFDDEEEPQVVPVKRPPSKIRPDLKGLKIAYPDVAKQSTQRSAPGEQQHVGPDLLLNFFFAHSATSSTLV